MLISQNEFCHRLWHRSWHRSRAQVREAYKKTETQRLQLIADYLKVPHEIALKARPNSKGPTEDGA